jgi:peroxiredoxin
MRLVLKFALVLITICLLSGYTDIKDQANDIIGSAAPELNLVDSQGNKVAVDAFSGKERLIVFLSVNVSEGQSLLKQLHSIRSEPVIRNLELVVIDIASGKKKLQSMKTRYDLGFEIYSGDSKQLMLDWRFRFLPTIFFVDADNIVRGAVEKFASTDKAALIKSLNSIKSKK